LTWAGALTVALYCGVSLAFSIIAFLAFRISEGISHYFSVHDAMKVTKAVVAAGVMTALVLFTFTRLEGIPRSTPFIHVLILLAGLITIRTLALMRNPEARQTVRRDDAGIEHIILIGSNRLSSLYIKFIRAYCPEHHRVIAVLDDQPSLIGRAIAGIPVLGSPNSLEPVLDEFAVHGIRTNRIIIGGDEGFLSPVELARIRLICEQREIIVDFIPQLVGLDKLQAARTVAPARTTELKIVANRSPVLPVSRYFRAKPYIDFALAVAGIIVFSPLFIMTWLLVLLDVGSPVLFWQQRLGQGGGNFLLHKFRTLRPPFDWNGQPVPANKRQSGLGHALRRARLDELPQLFNVLVGDMSLIGPRPLLPHDQPPNPALRLSVRPGITGWAQVHGANLVTNREKGALDEYYIRNASLWLDLRIIALTLRAVVTGERRSEEAVAQACATQAQEAGYIRKKPPHGAAAREGAHAQATGALIESTVRRRATAAVTPHQ
jgi:lipopolysaccharide/colanic/teichoic acid biosynthesis glycosyltransferase